jgi:GNAT superfamily N-acetyltransferase
MNKNSLLTKYDKDLRLHILYPEARKEVTGDVVRFVRKAPSMNFVSFTFANEHSLDRVIDSELEYFAPMAQPFTWKVFEHDLLPSLKDNLTVRGFAEEEDGPADVMVLDIQSAPADLFQPVKTDIRRVTDRDGLKDIVQVLDAVYGGHNTWVYDRLGLHLQYKDYLSVYVAYVDDQPASIAWTYFPRGSFATLFAGSTVPEHRKKGLYTNLLSVRLQEIRSRGYPFAAVETGDMSRPIVAKHGFQHLTTVWDYQWNRNHTQALANIPAAETVA